MAGSPTFEEYVAARGRALWRTAWLLTGDAHGAEDLVQAALVRCWPRWGRIARDGAVDGYVRKVLVTTYTDWKRRRWTGELPTAELPEGATDPALAEVRAVAGRRRRARVRGALALGAAVAVSAVVGPVAVLGGGGSADPLSPPIGGPSETAPTTATDAPTATPDPGEVPDVYPSQPCDEDRMVFGGPVDRKDVTSVSLCQIFSGVPEPAIPLVPESLLDTRTWLDAAVASDMTEMDCNLLSSSPQGLLFVHHEDGTIRVLDEGWCATIQVDEQPVVVRALYDAFVAGIDEQRSRFAYSAPGATAATCGGTRPTVAPVRPGREELVGSAVVCYYPDDAEEQRLGPEQFSRLRQAWALADLGRPSIDPGFCGNTRGIAVATSRGDVVHLIDQCGQLILSAPDFKVYRLPTSLDDVLMGHA